MATKITRQNGALPPHHGTRKILWVNDLGNVINHDNSRFMPAPISRASIGDLNCRYGED
jgi:hypothetical protein